MSGLVYIKFYFMRTSCVWHVAPRARDEPARARPGVSGRASAHTGVLCNGSWPGRGGVPPPLARARPRGVAPGGESPDGSPRA